MKTFFTFFASIALAASSALASQFTGGAPGAFLENASDARVLALGRAFSSVAEGTGGLYWNPAGLGMPYQSELSVGYSTLFEGAALQGLSFVHSAAAPVGFGFGVIQYQSPKVEERDASNAALGESTYKKGAYLFGFSWNPSRSWSWGATGKMVNQSVGGVSANAMDFDTGLLLKFDAVQFGVKIQNLLGGQLAREGGNDTLPMGWQAGASVRLFGSLLAAADIASNNDAGSSVHAGLEYRLFNIIALRGGLDQSSPVAGLGLTIKDVSFDYAVLPNADFGLSHRATLRLGFGGSPEDKLAAREQWFAASKARQAEAREQARQRKIQAEAQKHARSQAKDEGGAPLPKAGDNVIFVPKGRKLQVAVSDFDAKGISQIEAEAVTDYFRNAIVNANVFRLVDRSNMEKILTEQKFQQTGCTTEECAVQIGKILNVERMFTGSISVLSGTYVLTVRFLNVGTSEVESSRSGEAGSVKQLTDTATSLGLRFIQSLREKEEEKEKKPEEKKPESTPSQP